MQRRGRENRKSNLQRVNKLLDEYSKDEGKFQQRLTEILSIKKVWRTVAGDKISDISSPYRLNKGVLHVAVFDQMWIAELPYVKERLIEKIRDLNLSEQVTDIKFVLSKVKLAKGIKVKKYIATDEQIAFAEKVTKVIEDPAIRLACYNAMLAQITAKGKI